jgi:hypothetical protein
MMAFHLVVLILVTEAAMVAVAILLAATQQMVEEAEQVDIPVMAAMVVETPIHLVAMDLAAEVAAELVGFSLAEVLAPLDVVAGLESMDKDLMELAALI